MGYDLKRWEHFLEKNDAENLQDFAKTQLDFEFFLENRNKNINADVNPDLSFHCVLGSTKKSFDTQILLDPFEKDLYLPMAFVKLSNSRRWAARCSHLRFRSILYRNHEHYTAGTEWYWCYLLSM